MNPRLGREVARLVSILRRRVRRVPLSRYLAEVVRYQIRTPDEWPEGYFEQVFGRWEGEPLERTPQGDYEKRAELK